MIKSDREEVKTPNLDEIEILMSSEGGDLNSGFTAYNYLRSVPVKTTVINMGTIESIAMIPYLGSEERRAVPNSRFLIHNFTWTFGNSPVDINRVKEHTDSLLADVDRYVEIFNERTSGAEKPIDARVHLTGPAGIIGVATAIESRIVTSPDTSFPTLENDGFFDRIFR